MNRFILVLLGMLRRVMLARISGAFLSLIALTAYGQVDTSFIYNPASPSGSLDIRIARNATRYYYLQENVTFSFRESSPGVKTNSFRNMTSWDSGPYSQGNLRERNGAQDNFVMNYRLLFPTNYNASYSQGYPLIVMTHGFGERGNCWGTNCYWSNASYNPNVNSPVAPTSSSHELLNNDHNLTHGGKPHLDARNLAGSRLPHDPSMPARAFQGFVLFPQNLNGWGKDPAQDVIRIVRLAIKKYNIDPDRIYIHGLSDGGKGVYHIIQRAPWLFSAALPMSAVNNAGIYNNPELTTHIAEIPIWTFQGGQDAEPPPNRTENYVRQYRQAGMNVRYSLYPNIGHGTWGNAYAEPDFFTYMLTKNKSDIHVAFNNPKICGTTGKGVALSLSPGFHAYQWERDGQIIPGATGRSYTANVPGVYRARFSRYPNPTEEQWNQWSKPVTIREASPPVPEVEQIGTVVLRDLNDVRNARFVAPAGYQTYRWYQDGQPVTPANRIVNTPGSNYFEIKGCDAPGPNCQFSGAYTLVTEDFDGCPSPPSKPVHVLYGTHNMNAAYFVDSLSAPRKFKGVVKSPTSALFTWEDHSREERAYEIWRRRVQPSVESWVLVTMTGEDETLFLDKGLAANSVYHYKIRGVSNKKRSYYQPGKDAVNQYLVISTMTETVKPSPPYDLIATAAAEGAIRLTWKPSHDMSGIRQYIVEYNGISIETNSAETTTVISGLGLNQHIAFTVRGQDTAGNLSDPSNPAVGHTYIDGLFYKHSTGAWSSLSEMASTWDFPEFTGWVPNFTLAPRTQDEYFNFEFSGYLYITTPGIYKFSLQSDDGSMMWLNGILAVNHDGLHGADVKEGTVTFDLAAGHYPILVRFFEYTGGESLTVRYTRLSSPIQGWTVIPNSMLRSGTPPPLPTPPASPSNLIATASGMTSINLTWAYNGSNPDVAFEIQRAPSATGPFTTIARPSESPYSDTGLVPNRTYYYQVRTSSSNAVSNFTTIASATTAPDTEVPTAPGTPTLRNKGFSTVAFTWAESNDNVGLKGYEIYINNSLQHFAESPVFSGAGFEPGETYSFYIIAVDLNDNKSEPSGSLNVTTDLGNVYVTKSNAAVLNNLASWTDPLGQPPASFAHNGQTFKVQHSLPINTGWSVEGSVSKVIIDDGVTVIVDEGKPLTGKVEIPGDGVLDLKDNTLPNLGKLSPTSTVRYSKKVIQRADYGNLHLSSAEGYLFPAGNIVVRGDLVAVGGSGLKSIQAETSTSTIEVGGNLRFLGAPQTLAPASGVTLRFAGNGNHTIETPASLGAYRIEKPGAGAVILTNGGTPVTLTLGSTAGGGLSLNTGSELNIGNNELAIIGAGTINPANEGGRLAVNNGSITISSSSNQPSNLGFKNGANVLSRLSQNTSGNGNVIVRDPVQVTDGIKIRRGKLESNGFITLLSTNTKTANLEEIENGGQVIGAMNVQRYMSNKARTYRYISASVEGVTVAHWQTFFAITGSFTGASKGAGLGNLPSMFIRQPEGWVGYPQAPLSNTAPIEKGRGYAAFVRNTTPLLLHASGVPYQGTFTFPNLIPQQGGDDVNDWNLLGNPYPSTIAWSNDPAAWQKNGIGNIVAVRNNFNTTSGQFEYYDAGEGLAANGEGLADGKIAPGQAFWIKATGANPSLTITEKAKHTGQQTLYRESKIQASHLRIRLSQDNKKDAALVILTPYASDIYEAEYDGIKMSNEGLFNFSTLTENNYPVAINNLTNSFCTKKVLLNLENTPAGKYTLQITSPETLYGVGLIQLHDRYIDSVVTVAGDTDYLFQVTSDPRSAGNARFELEFSRPELKTDVVTTVNQDCNAPAQIKLKGTQPGATYSLFYGNRQLTGALSSAGQDLDFTISTDDLERGEIPISIQVGFPGCGSTTMKNVVSIFTFEQPIVSASDVSVCEGTATTLRATVTGAAFSYEWFGENGRIKGASTSSLDIDPAYVNQYYGVRAVDAMGCPGPLAEVYVEAVPLEMPEIEQVSDTLVASVDAERYHWRLNGLPVAGAGASYLVPEHNGTYVVSVSKGGCNRVSREFVITSVAESLGAIDYHLYPNPTTSEQIHVRGSSREIGNVEVRIVDVVGRSFYTNRFTHSELNAGVRIQTEHPLNAGVYYMKLDSASKKQTIKFIIKSR